MSEVRKPINDSNDKIVNKIKSLLALSRDSNQDEESQSALLLAQHLMIKYRLDSEDIEDYEVLNENEVIGEESVTLYKRLSWFEKELARIISKNFKVKFYYNSKSASQKSKQRQTKIMFFGKLKDLELAKEMFILASEVLKHHTKIYIENFYEETYQKRSYYWTANVKRNYIRGFLIGLDEQFDKQVLLLKKEYPLVTLIPMEVEQAYEQFSSDFGLAAIKELPQIELMSVFYDGIEHGQTVDFTQSTLGEKHVH